MRPNRPDRVGQVFAALGKCVCYVGLFLGMQILVVLPAMIVPAIQAALAGGDEEAIYDAIQDADVMALTLISGLLTIVIVLAFYLIRRKKFSEALWLRPVPAPALFTGVSLAPALYFVVVVVLSVLPEAWTENYGEASSGIANGTVLGVVSVAVVAPVAEELIFRGLVMTRLSRVMSGWLAVLLSAAVFGLCHGELVWFCYAFVLGAFFGFIDLRAGSILPSILGHMMFNAIGQIMTFLPETEEGMEAVAALGVLFVVAVVLPILDRKGIAALFRPAPRRAFNPPGEWELPSEPGTYEYDPWDE